jgi:hypothetical protein
VAPEIGQPCIDGELVLNELFGHTRQHGLAAVRQVAQPRGLVDRRARVVALVAQTDVAGVHPDAQPDRRKIRALEFQRARHRVACAGERGDEAVAFTLFDWAHTVVLRDEL